MRCILLFTTVALRLLYLGVAQSLRLLLLSPQSYQINAFAAAATNNKEAKGKSGQLRKPRAVIHVGPHKTGTTTIQNYLSDNKIALADNHSVYFLGDCPKADAFFVNIHLHRLPLSTVPGDFFSADRKTGIKDYLNQIELHSKASKNPSTIVISSENMEHLDEAGFVILRDLLSSYTIDVIYYYRETVSRMYSMFMESSKWNIPELYRLFFDLWQGNIEKTVTYRSDDKTLKLLSEVFGRKAITVVDYDGALAHGVEPHQVFACDILQICQLPFKHLRNKSLTFSARAPSLPPPSMKTNAGISMTGAQLFGIFYNMSVSMKCNRNMTQTAMLNLYKKPFNAIANQVPTITVKANEQLVALSKKTDTHIRATYGPLLYGKTTTTATGTSTTNCNLHSSDIIGNKILSKPVPHKRVEDYTYTELDRAAFITASQIYSSSNSTSSSTEVTNVTPNVKMALALLKEMRNKYLNMAFEKKALYGCKNKY